MNFFAHAAIAEAQGRGGRFILGAMLPDLVAMARVGRPSVEDGDLRDGVAFHFETDTAFHGSRAFLGLVAESTADLRRHDFPRGARRAAAHVAIELLLDGLLSRDPDARASFMAVFEEGIRERGPGHLRFATPAEALRWDDLLDRLRSGELIDGYGDPAFVTARVLIVLSRRPRLAIPETHRAFLEPWARRLQVRVRSELPVLLAELRQGLASLLCAGSNTGARKELSRADRIG